MHFVFLKKGHRSWEGGSVKVSSAAEFQAGVVAASSIVEVRSLLHNRRYP
jgi:hypothetical protein